MTTPTEQTIAQRLEQHADALETILDRLDSIDCRLRSHLSMIRTDKLRLKDLEAIVLPDPDPKDHAYLTL